MKFKLEIIAHRKQRYDTVGDWFKRGKEMVFRISRMADYRWVILVFIHEMIEFWVCKLTGVKAKDVDRFDMEYEQARSLNARHAPCGCKFWDEPGNDLHAPYREAHRVATACEKLIAKALGVDWLEYDEAVESLSE